MFDIGKWMKRRMGCEIFDNVPLFGTLDFAYSYVKATFIYIAMPSADLICIWMLQMISSNLQDVPKKFLPEGTIA